MKYTRDLADLDFSELELERGPPTKECQRCGAMRHELLDVWGFPAPVCGDCARDYPEPEETDQCPPQP